MKLRHLDLLVSLLVTPYYLRQLECVQQSTFCVACGAPLIFGNLPRVAGWEQYSAEPLLIHLHHGNSPSPPSEASNLVFTVVDSGVLGRQAGNKGKKAGFIVLSSLPQALSLASVIYLLLPLTNVFLLHLSS